MAAKREHGGSQPTVAAEYIKKLIAKFPNHGDATLARKAYITHPELFQTQEHARGMVRYWRGHQGQSHRKSIRDKSNIKPVTYNSTPYKVPESKYKDEKVFKLPKSIRKVLVLGDVHFPFHDSVAINAALEYGKKEGIDCIYLNGDILDMYQISFHEKDPRSSPIKEELELCREFFAGLRKSFNCPIYFIPGNHEKRLERYLAIKAPELLDVPEFRLDVLLRMGEYKIIYLEHGTDVFFGKLLVEHGDKMKGSGGVNPARSLNLKFKRPVLCNHFHRTSSSNSVVYKKEMVMSWSLGCLCLLNPEYMPQNEWNHGFAIVDIFSNGNFTVDNKQIIDGNVY